MTCTVTAQMQDHYNGDICISASVIQQDLTMIRKIFSFREFNLKARLYLNMAMAGY